MKKIYNYDQAEQIYHDQKIKESDIQKQIVKYLRLKKIRHFAVPNEQTVKILKMFKIPDRISFAIYGKMEAMGLTPGIPDLCIIPGKGKTYYMEVKKPGKGLTKDQPEVHHYLNENGYEVVIVFSLEGAIAALKNWEVI